jgi:Ni/Fe-hydrogenase subunit HybB-like protein
MPYASSAPYLIAAAACFLLARPGRSAPAARLLEVQRRTWTTICIVLAVLGIARPFEVHSRLSDVLRTSALTEGWYSERMQHQLDLLLVAAFSAAVVAAFLLFETRKWHLSTRLGALASLYLCGVLVLNILSLHGLDALLSRRLLGVPLRWGIDVPALAVTVAFAFSFRRHAVRQGQTTYRPSGPA